MREMLSATSEFVSIRLEATDLNGNPITTVTTGESFLIKGYFTDRRGDPGVTLDQNLVDQGKILPDVRGFTSAYINVTYDSLGFDYDSNYDFTTGAVQSGSISPFTQFDTSIDGLVQNIGYINSIFTSDTPKYQGEVEFLDFRMVAQAPGNYQLDQAFIPHYTIEVPYQVYDPNVAPEDRPYSYTNGVPDLQLLTDSTDINNYYTDNGEPYIYLLGFNGKKFDQPGDVYFEGIGLTVVAAQPDVDFEIRYVGDATQTLAGTSRGEVSTLPINDSYIDEWNYFYVELYAKAPQGGSVSAATFQIDYDPTEFQFVKVDDNVSDYTNLRYKNTFQEVDSTNGHISVGFNTIQNDLGDNNFALVGRVQLRSLIELQVDYSQGQIQSYQASDINVSHANATIDNAGENSILVGDLSGTHSFVVWPVLFDIDNGGDRRVGLSEYNSLLTQFGKTTAGDLLAQKYDFDHNGKVGLSDYDLYLRNLGSTDQTASKRNNPTWYIDLMNGVVPAPAAFSLEGEAVTTQQTTTSQPTSSQSVVESGPPTPAATQTAQLNGTFFLPINTTTTQTTTQASTTSTDSSTTEPPTTDSTDQVVSQWDDQSDLIAMAADQSSDSTASDSEETDFVSQTDEVLALWDDESEI